MSQERPAAGGESCRQDSYFMQNNFGIISIKFEVIFCSYKIYQWLYLQTPLCLYHQHKTMQNLSAVILKFLFCVTVHCAVGAAPFAYEPVKQNAPDFSEAFQS